MKILAIGKQVTASNPDNNKDSQPEFLNGQLYAQHFKIIAQAMRTAAAAIGNNDIKIGLRFYSNLNQNLG